MNFIDFLIALFFLSIFIYALVLLLFGLYKMLSLAVNNLNSKDSSKNISYYIKFFLVDRVCKGMSHVKIIAVSIISALLIIGCLRWFGT